MTDPEAVESVVVAGHLDHRFKGRRVLHIDAERDVGTHRCVKLTKGRDMGFQVISLDLGDRLLGNRRCRPS